MVDHTLHGAFGYLSAEDTVRNGRYVYFIRLTEQGIPGYDHAGDTFAELSSYFLVGSTSGKFLHQMVHVMQEVSHTFIVSKPYL